METFLLEIWREDVCYELAKEKRSYTFPFTDEGRTQMKAFLEEEGLKKDFTE
jgi:hypothetical protein